MGSDDYSCFPQLLFPILLQLLLKSFLQENLTPRGGVSINTKRGKKSVPRRAGRFHPRRAAVSGTERSESGGRCCRRPAPASALRPAAPGLRAPGKSFAATGAKLCAQPPPPSLCGQDLKEREGGSRGRRREEESLCFRL